MSKYTPQYWAPLIAAAAPDLPTGKLVAWEAEESDGSPAALGSRYEVGIFQVNLEDGPAWGATLDTLHGNFTSSPTSQVLTRELTDDEEQLQVSSGVAFIRWVLGRTQGELDNLGLDWSTDDVWCLVKLYHALPRLWDNYLAAAARAGAASSWSSFREWTTSLSQSDAAQVNSAVAAHYYPFDRFFRNAEKVGYATRESEAGSAELLVLAFLAAAAWFLTRLL